MTDLVERFIAAFRRTGEEGFTPEIEQELMDAFPAIEALSERIGVLEADLNQALDMIVDAARDGTYSVSELNELHASLTPDLSQ